MKKKKEKKKFIVHYHTEHELIRIFFVVLIDRQPNFVSETAIEEMRT